MVLHAVISASREKVSDNDPLVANAVMGLTQSTLLFGRPWIPTNARLELIEIALAALLAGAVLQLLCDLAPCLGCGDGWGPTDLQGD